MSIAKTLVFLKTLFFTDLDTSNEEQRICHKCGDSQEDCNPCKIYPSNPQTESSSSIFRKNYPIREFFEQKSKEKSKHCNENVIKDEIAAIHETPKIPSESTKSIAKDSDLRRQNKKIFKKIAKKKYVTKNLKNILCRKYNITIYFSENL